MHNHKKLLPFALILGIIAFVAIPPTPASAFSFGKLFDNVKNFITAPFIKHDLTIDQKIDLVSSGDINKNGQIDAGDTVRYSYVLINGTDKTINFANLNTHINTKEINSIDNIQGVMSIDQSKDSLIIPNFTIKPNQVRKISFEATINYYKDSDISLSTEAELSDSHNNSVSKAEKKEVKVKRMDEATFNKFVHKSN